VSAIEVPAPRVDDERLDARRVPLAQRRGGPFLLGVVGVIGAMAIMELVSRVGIIPTYSIPPLSEILAELFRNLGESWFWWTIGATMKGWAIGLLIGSAIGVPIGLLMGSSRYVQRALRPTVEFLRPVPGVALIPLAILLFGQSTSSDVFLVAFGVVWPMLIQAMYGVQEVDDVAKQTARSFRLSRLERLRFLVVPSALPFVATGLRISTAVALIVAVTAELVIGSEGIGKEIYMNEQAGQLKEMYALIVAAGILGVVIHVVFSRGEARLLHWHQSQRAGQEA
jgi:ABC-type nitrate/sulfonate/bicarbonate transport system permease component